MTKSSFVQMEKRLVEGRCPKCGELGALDVCGGANCSKHGLYTLVMTVTEDVVNSYLSDTCSRNPNPRDPGKILPPGFFAQPYGFNPSLEIDVMLVKGIPPGTFTQLYGRQNIMVKTIMARDTPITNIKIKDETLDRNFVGFTDFMDFPNDKP
jgi:hypothetical protein